MREGGKNSQSNTNATVEAQGKEGSAEHGARNTADRPIWPHVAKNIVIAIVTGLAAANEKNSPLQFRPAKLVAVVPPSLQKSYVTMKE